MSTYLDDPVAATPSLPQSFEYDEETKVLEVEYTNGTRERYYDVPATLHFLLPHHANPNRVADFLQQKSQYRSEKIR